MDVLDRLRAPRTLSLSLFSLSSSDVPKSLSVVLRLYRRLLASLFSNSHSLPLRSPPTMHQTSPLTAAALSSSHRHSLSLSLYRRLLASPFKLRPPSSRASKLSTCHHRRGSPEPMLATIVDHSSESSSTRGPESSAGSRGQISAIVSIFNAKRVYTGYIPFFFKDNLPHGSRLSDPYLPPHAYADGGAS